MKNENLFNSTVNFYNINNENFIEFLSKFYGDILDIKSNDESHKKLINELFLLYTELNEKGIDENIVREKVNYFLRNSVKIKDIQVKLVINTNKIEENTEKLNTKAEKSEFLKLVDNVDLIKNYSASKEYVNTKIESLGSNKTFKGSCVYNELPISAEIGDYWYVYDRNTNYCWNGSQWFDIGNNLGVGSNTIGVQNLDINIQEDIGEYKENIGLLTENQAYYPNSNVATAFTTNKWNNIIIDNLIDGTVFKVTLSYINSDNMYGIIFTDNQNNVIATDLKGTDTQQNVKDYRIITPKGATKIILNCFEPSINDFKVTMLNYGKIATRKYVIENSITNDDLGKIYYTGDNKIDSSKYENKLYDKIFPADESFIEIPISEYANLGDGVGYMFNIWFSDGSKIKGTGKVSYLNERGEEITWYAFGNKVVSNYPITGAKKVRIYSLPRTNYPNIENKIIKGFTLSNKALSNYEKYKVNVTYGKVEEIATLKAQQVIEEKSETINDKILMLPSTNYDNVIRSINRIGYDVYNPNTPPEQSIESFKLAYNKGFRILLCDLRFTKDNVPVCIHDATINSVARNIDGSEISETITVAEKNLAELNRYDFGIKKGNIYSGTGILTLDEMCKLVKNLGVELYIEVKDSLEGADEKINKAVNIVRKYGLKNVSWAHDNVKKFGNFTKIAPEYRIGTMPLEMNTTKINELLSLKTSQNSLFWFAWDTSPLPIEIVNLMQKNNIEFEVGTIDSKSSLFDWFNSNELKQYCTGISSNKIVAGKVILENEINN